MISRSLRGRRLSEMVPRKEGSPRLGREQEFSAEKKPGFSEKAGLLRPGNIPEFMVACLPVRRPLGEPFRLRSDTQANQLAPRRQ